MAPSEIPLSMFISPHGKPERDYAFVPHIEISRSTEVGAAVLLRARGRTPNMPGIRRKNLCDDPFLGRVLAPERAFLRNQGKFQ